MEWLKRQTLVTTSSIDAEKTFIKLWNLSRFALTMFADHDDYIAKAPEELRHLLLPLRAQFVRALPEAEEVIAYKMPGFRIGKNIVAGYAAFSKQCGLYVSPSAIKSLSEDIARAGLTSTKAGVTFSPKRPIPDELVEKLALASRNSLDP